MERDWKEAKPKWVVEAAIAEIDAMRIRLALRWPDEARPMPVPFRWGDYDRLYGEVVPGEYFSAHYGRVEIRKKNPDETGWKDWRFKSSSWGNKWTDSVIRGPLYLTEHEAKLARLWAACDEAAKKLSPLWDAVQKDRGFL